MTGQQLKTITRFAAAWQLPLSHKRVGYFVHIVHIGSHDYLDAAKAMKRLQTLQRKLQTK